MASAGGAEEIRPLQACWAPSALVAKPGEDLVLKNVPEAFVPPPTGVLVGASPVPREQRGSIRRVELPEGKKLVALTFDLCEQPDEVAGYQGQVVDYLRQFGIKATFFASGKWMLTHRTRAQQLMADPLFELANHTWAHRNLRLLSGATLLKEVEAAQLAYEQVRDELAARRCLARDGKTLGHERAPRRLSLFRFPFGACDVRSLQAVASSGLLAIQWDVSSGDPAFGQSAERIQHAVLRDVRPGSIVLFHANGRGVHTASALPKIVAGLRAQGYAFVTVSELLKAGRPLYTPTCYDNRPGDTDRYDELGRRLELRFEHERARTSERSFAAARNLIHRGPIDPLRPELEISRTVTPMDVPVKRKEALPLPRPGPEPH